MDGLVFLYVHSVRSINASCFKTFKIVSIIRGYCARVLLVPQAMSYEPRTKRAIAADHPIHTFLVVGCRGQWNYHERPKQDCPPHFVFEIFQSVRSNQRDAAAETC